MPEHVTPDHVQGSPVSQELREEGLFSSWYRVVRALELEGGGGGAGHRRLKSRVDIMLRVNIVRSFAEVMPVRHKVSAGAFAAEFVILVYEIRPVAQQRFLCAAFRADGGAGLAHGRPLVGHSR